MKMKTVLLWMFLLPWTTVGQDPRAVSIRKVHGIDEKRTPGLRREETAFSIVIYGAFDNQGEYRIEGLDRPMKLDELTEVLRLFYGEFPESVPTTTERPTRTFIHLPNILYCSRGWNEVKEDGRNLVTEVTKEHGVALYYFTTVPGYRITFNKADSFITSESENIEYYQKRLEEVAARVMAARVRLRRESKPGGQSTDPPSP